MPLVLTNWRLNICLNLPMEARIKLKQEMSSMRSIGEMTYELWHKVDNSLH